MIFTPLPLAGAFVIDPELRADERGSFARLFCTSELAANGLEHHVAQCNTARNGRKGIVRGMHFQRPPHAEVKVVRCTSGEVFDVLVDVRPGSPTRYQWCGVRLSAENQRMAYVPKGFAHGYQTITDTSDVFYVVTTPYAPEAEAGLRWDDPALGIEWPLPDAVVSPKDSSWPLVEAEP